MMQQSGQSLQIQQFNEQGQHREAENKNTWLFVRIYCQQAEADEVLLNLIAPCARLLLRQELITRFFFIRYFEGGFHLRVRFCGERAKLLGCVREEINRQICQYFAQRGEVLVDPLDWGPEGLDDQFWRPCLQKDMTRPMPSFEYDRYEREVERYGGLPGLQISEQHFMQCSELALRILAQERNGSSSRRNAALLLLDILAETFQLTDRQKATVFSDQCHYWMSSAWCTAQHRELFAQEYARHQLGLQRLLQQKSQVPEHKSRAVWSPLMVQWRAALNETYNSLVALEAQQELSVTPLELMFSYIHLFCNRLGFFPREEAYLTYLLYRTYQEWIEVGSPVLV
jgi:thiopeptide-type bacteriocin biosynthesis protein